MDSYKKKMDEAKFNTSAGKSSLIRYTIIIVYSFLLLQFEFQLRNDFMRHCLDEQFRQTRNGHNLYHKAILQECLLIAKERNTKEETVISNP